MPLHILLDGKDFRDGVDDVPADVHQRHATTAGATPAELADAYREALPQSGGDGVVAVHISAALSSTYSSAVSAAREFGPAVRVVNSRSAAMGVGFVALAAAQQAASGADLNAVEAAARSAVPARSCVHRRAPAGQPAAQRPDPQGGVVVGFRAVAEAAVCASTSTAGWCSASGSAPPPRRMRR